MESLILEGVSEDIIFEALDEHYRVSIHYAGDDNTARGVRVIEVYAYGQMASGNYVIRAFQTKGDTSGSGVQGWKLFRVDRITSWEPVMKGDGSADLFWLGNQSSLFNQNNDNSMAKTIKIANFKT